MSDYIKQLKTLVITQLKGYKIRDKSASVFQLIKDNNVVATIKDQGEFIIVTIANKDYKYDKWYTKPEHLAKVIVNYFKSK
ncbi:MAG: hypothetical protein J7K21_00595 [Desulfurococcales archaeon]|nr:hypothetical protein [Desulfurococcales archaeon]